MLAGLVMELTSTHSQYAGRRRRFTFDVAQTPDATVMTLGGELDVVCADAFRRRFSDATEDEPAHVVLDLRELDLLLLGEQRVAVRATVEQREPVRRVGGLDVLLGYFVKRYGFRSSIPPKG